MSYEVILLGPAGIRHVTCDEFVAFVSKATGQDEETIYLRMMLPESIEQSNWIAIDASICLDGWVFIPNYIIDDSIDIVFEDILSMDNQPKE